MMTEVTGYAESSVTLLLALFGIGMTLGALAAGPLTDRALRPTLYGSLGALGFLPTTPLQMLVMNKARLAPTLASASSHSAFNMANAGGAWLGGAAISAGWGWTSPALVGAALALAGLAIAVTAGALDRERGTSKVVARRVRAHAAHD